MDELIRRLLPVFFLLAIGFIAKQRKMFQESFIEGLKTLIIKIALPAVLFDAFSKMTLQVSYLLLFVLVFLYCSFLYLAGHLLHKLLPKIYGRTYTAGYLTGFEFGMIGVGLFGAIWGMDKLPVIMLVGFGHELFIWFFYVPLISMKGNNRFSIVDIMWQFLKTPTIIAIILGILTNLSGTYPKIQETSIGGSVLAMIEFLKPLTSPLILIVIGYTMIFQRRNLHEMTIYVISRLSLVLGLGTLVLFAVRSLIPDLDPLFYQAFYAFILLPAPYILPLYIQEQKETAFFTQLLVYSTVVSFIGYGILVWVSF